NRFPVLHLPPCANAICLQMFIISLGGGRRGVTVVGNKNIGHALDNDKWLSTVSQYDNDRYWNKFRDVSL
uniref:Uncharacterized protein n=1 Tax=Hucho hucho TaxID=62062 RepID=A0A4W5RS43_9TELE